MIYRKGVAALIRNKSGEFLVVNLVSFKPEFYAICGGGIEEHETPIDAVYREVFEELCIKPELLSLVGKSDTPHIRLYSEPKIISNEITHIGSQRLFFGFDFLGSDDDIVLQPEEVRGYVWSHIDDLGNYLLFEHQNQHADTRRYIGEIFGM